MTDRELWTVEEAAQLLAPPITGDQVLALIALAWIRPAGRRQRARGRPLEYDAGELQRAHAQVAGLLADTERRGGAPQ